MLFLLNDFFDPLSEGLRNSKKYGCEEVYVGLHVKRAIVKTIIKYYLLYI